jgi:DNA-binding SARP family transcriptional activator
VGEGWRFHLTGPLQVRHGGAAVPIDAAKQRVLIAVLALAAGEPVPAQRLIACLWDDQPPPSARNTLQNYVLRLRRVLQAHAQPGPLVSTAAGYRLDVQTDTVDVHRFRSLVRSARSHTVSGDHESAAALLDEALALWRGQPLADVPSEVLHREVVPGLVEQHLTALEARIELDLQLGRHAQRIPDLIALCTEHPLRERFRAQLMLALYRSGRTADALDTYRQASAVLAEELGIDPGPELRTLHQAVLTNDPTLTIAGTAPEPTLRHPSAPLAGPRAPRPRQLPAAAGHFTGRFAELEWLTGLPERSDPAGAGTVVISAIDGMAGIGKTTLAIHAAHRVADRFEGGQLFIDLHGYTQGHPPREPGQALQVLLRALGVAPHQIPQDTEECAALYRQRLAGTGTLIVLDNALNEAQVRPLLPGDPGCLVLVTSRRRLKGLDDARSLSLDLLPPADAAALLRAVAGPERIAADDPLLGEIATLCGHLPLALRIAAALLRHRPTWSLGHLAALLCDQHARIPALFDGERDLATVFDLSYRHLEQPHRLLLCRIALMPGPHLDRYAAAALADTDPATAARRLEDLVDHNLLITYAPGRYRLHDLIRAHARTLAVSLEREPERDAALGRLLRYYAHTAQTASLLIARTPRPAAPDGPAPAHAPEHHTPDTARAWLRTEHFNLDAAFTHAHTHALDEHILALAAGLAEILRSDGPWTHALEIYRAAADSAERQNQPAAHANALNDLGRVWHLTGDVPAAADALERALEIHRRIGNHLGEANALNDLGRVRRLTGDFPAAAHAQQQALDIYRRLGNHLGEANTLNDLGRVRYVTGDLPAAAHAQQQALEIYRRIGNHLGEANALADLGRVRYLTGDLPAAADTQQQALEINRRLGNHLGEADALANLGRVWRLTGDFPAAAHAQQQALEIYRRLGNHLGEANTLANLGWVWRLTGDYPAAAHAQQQALQIYRQIGNRGGEAYALNHYAATVAATGDRPGALALYHQALAMNRELNKPDDEAISLEGIAEHHLATGDTDQGTDHLNQALEIYQRLGMRPDIDRVNARLADIAPQ